MSGESTKVTRIDSGDTLNVASGGKLSGGPATAVAGPVMSLRQRVTTAQVNAGATLLAAPGANYAYRMVRCALIAVGGAASGATSVDVLGTQSTSSVKLMSGAIAGLTQSAVLKSGDANGAVLADGASFAKCDENTAITIGKTGSSLATATNIDVILDYVVEKLT